MGARDARPLLALRLPALRAPALARRAGALLPRDGVRRAALRHARRGDPGTLADLREYFAAQIGSETITVTEPARAIAARSCARRSPGPMRMLRPAHRLATISQLPPRIREEYGLRLTTVQRPLVGVAGHSMRLGAWPVLRVASRIRPPSRAFVT